MQINAKRHNQPQPRGKASSLEVLGVKGPNGKPPAKWAFHHAQLLKLRHYLTGQRQVQSASAKAVPGPTGEHIADVATDSYDRDWALAMASSAQSLLYEVDQALNRIAAGSYGHCELTGQAIEPERLRALPWTRFCARAQAELESRGTTGRTRLGRLGSYGSAPAEADQDEDSLEDQSAEREAA